MKKYFVLLLCGFVFLNATAQLKVDYAGNIGIDTDADTLLSALAVGCEGANKIYAKVAAPTEIALETRNLYPSFGGWRIGHRIISYANTSSDKVSGIYAPSFSFTDMNTGRSYAIVGIGGGCTSGYNVGVFGNVRGNNDGAGIVGSCKNTEIDMPPCIQGGRFAGYFDGNVKVIGTLTATNITTTSDIRLKDNISSLSESPVSTSLFDLKPVRYTFRQYQTEYVTDTGTIVVNALNPESVSFKKEHFGLIAQDVKEVFPELVSEDADGMLSVNYIELIPIMIQTLKELKTEVEMLKGNKESDVAKAASVDNAILEIADTSNADSSVPSLSQNTPNPFNTDTRVAYYLPETVSQAAIYIYDMQGAQKSVYSLTERGNAVVTINGGSLNAGMYLYSLIADGKLVDTKRMILTK